MSEGLALNTCIYDAEGVMCDYRIMAVNKAFYKTADYLGSEITGRLATDLFAIPVGEIREFWQAHRYRTEPFTHEYVSPLSRRTYRITASPIVDHQFVTSFVDVTEQVAMKQKLQESEAFLRNMADSLPVLVAYWLPDYTCKFVNKAYSDWFGHAPEYFIGRPARELLGEDVFAERRPLYDAVLRGEPRVNIASMRTADGKIRDFMTSLVLLKLELQKKLKEHLGDSQVDLRELVRPLDEVMRIVRGMSHRLSPVYLKKLGIVTALEDLCEKVGNQSGIAIAVQLSALEGVFVEDWSIDLYRIVQEALTNAVKHSGATKIAVTATRAAASVVVEVRDDGRGSVDFQGEKSGLGLLLMRQRASTFAGTVDFDSSGQGFAVRVAIPQNQNT